MSVTVKVERHTQVYLDRKRASEIYYKAWVVHPIQPIRQENGKEVINWISGGSAPTETEAIEWTRQAYKRASVLQPEYLKILELDWDADARNPS